MGISFSLPTDTFVGTELLRLLFGISFSLSLSREKVLRPSLRVQTANTAVARKIDPALFRSFLRSEGSRL